MIGVFSFLIKVFMAHLHFNLFVSVLFQSKLFIRCLLILLFERGGTNISVALLSCGVCRDGL